MDSIFDYIAYLCSQGMGADVRYSLTWIVEGNSSTGVNGRICRLSLSPTTNVTPNLPYSKSLL